MKNNKSTHLKTTQTGDNIFTKLNFTHKRDKTKKRTNKSRNTVFENHQIKTKRLQSMYSMILSLQRKHLFGLSALAITSMLTAGCLSGGGGGGNGPSDLTGTFVDSPVSGLNYSTSTQKGTTDSDGRFTYRADEDVRFSLAGIDLGSAKGQEIITPVDLSGDNNSANPYAVNLSRFLQTLDADGNLTNGIEITDAIITAIESFGGLSVDFADTEAFDTLMEGSAGLLAHLNNAGVFAENAKNADRQIRTSAQAWQHLRDNQDGNVDFSKTPIVFVHGGAGSASQFESQAQRLILNGYPRSYLATFEYDTNAAALANVGSNIPRLNATIDALLLATGADSIHLMGHSMGTEVSRIYLSDPERAAKVTRYVNLDGRADSSDKPFGGVPVLALWGQYVTRSVNGATNVYPTEEDPVGHIEVATSSDSFERIYRFFNNDTAPRTSKITAAEGSHVWIAGRANIFPDNIGATDTVLEITEIDPNTAQPLSDQPLFTHAIGDNGLWGPVRLDKGSRYEFVLRRPDAANADHYFYREPYDQDNFQVRLNTSLPTAGVGRLLTRSANHTNLAISRDMELWGDQGERNDTLTINNYNVVTEFTGPLLQRLSNFFVHDRNADRVSNLTAADPVFHAIPFMSGMDLYLPASTNGTGVIRIALESRRGGETQIINVPNWPSSKARSVSVHFRDYSN